MNFKSLAQQDNENIFLNTDEFAAKHTIDGIEMDVSLDQDELLKRNEYKTNNYDGIFTAQKLIFVRGEQFGELPYIGRFLTFNEEPYRVVDASDDCGIYAITLEANES